MNISKESIDNLNAVVKIKVTPEDYKEQVEKEIKKYQKNARIPGFRPGKVPEGMVRKMYGKAILAEELNKILNDSIYKYLTENKIDILGNPLPKAENSKAMDFESQTEFEFLYDLGLAPEFNVDFNKVGSFPYYKASVDQEMTDKYVNDIRRRYGKFSNPEVAEDNDILYGEFVELNDDGTEKENGIKHTSTVAIEFIKADQKAKFIGAKKDDVVRFNPSKSVDNQTELAAMVGVPKEEVANVKSDFNYTIKSVNRVGKAELNTELFEKLYGTGVVNSEAEFNERVKTDIANMFVGDSDRKLKFDIVEKLIETANIKLPDDFLKRWIVASNEKPITKEQLEAEYDSYAKGLKWRLIENKIIKDNDIQVNADELKDFAKGMFREQFAQYGQSNIDDETLNGMVERYLGKEEQLRKLYENLASNKVFDFLKSKFTLDNKEVSYDEFVKLVSAI